MEDITGHKQHLSFDDRAFPSLVEIVDYIFLKGEVTIKEGDGECHRVPCIRVFPKSPLNGVIVGYE